MSEGLSPGGLESVREYRIFLSFGRQTGRHSELDTVRTGTELACLTRPRYEKGGIMPRRS